MSTKPEVFTFICKVLIADANGIAITEGSVLRSIETDRSQNTRGVVTWIGRPGGPYGPAMSAIGDIGIRTGHGNTRVTNRYSKWQHIPHDEQTYEERYLSWQQRKYEHDDSRDISKDEGIAIDGIMALLPEDTVDWNYGPYPDSLEAALGFLSDHLTQHTKP